ncbi:MAG: MBL fold metallo-hydrolase [Pseudomonadota bacterium]
MRITCLGAARTVTGSSYLVEKDGQTCFLVECGLFQGSRQLEKRNWLATPYRAKDLDALFITHAHIDHSGLTPRLVRQGFGGPIYATEATCELLRILWLDSAHIQEMEAEWQSKKNRRQGSKPVEPLYETVDAEAAIALLNPVELEDEREFLPGVRARFVQAGHILGAASLLLTLRVDGGVHRVGFSGDLGRPGQLIVPDSEQLPRPDTLFMETTYGNRSHRSLQQSQDELLAVVKQAYAEGGKVLIPAFAVERTQELLYTLGGAWRAGELPEDMPVFLDSPLAIAATQIFRKYPELYDEHAKALLDQGIDPLDFPNLRFTPNTEQSRAINENQGPAVIIAGNGMATAGRIKHHLKHNLWRENCHVVLVGYQAMGTTGRALVEGATKVRIFREEVAVNAHIHTIGGFSAHADQGELLAWLKELAHPGLSVYLMHGEEPSAQAFRKLASEQLPQLRFHLPRIGETLHLQPLAAQPAKATGLPQRTRDLAERLSELARRLDEGQVAPMGMEKALAALERLAARETE